MKIKLAVCSLQVAVAAGAMAAGISVSSPARDWQQSSITGNGTIGAMVRGDVNNDTVSLSHCRLYMPISDEGDYRERDPFMAACDLKIGTDVWGIRDYSRTTDFETGEVIVRCQSQHGEYVRRVVALRPDNLIAIKVDDKRHIRFALDSIPMRGRDELAMFEDGVRSVVHERREGLDYYRLDWSRTNKWNKLTGYEVALLVNNSREKDIEAFVAIEPILKGQESNFASMKARLEAAAAKGYDVLVERHAKRQREMMRRVEFALESTGEVKGDFIGKAFQAGRYNIISATGGAHVPNLQGVWAGTWSAPWKASFTTNGNLPCAVSFFVKGATPELCGSLLAWLEERLPEMREGAKEHYNARGFHVAAQTTVSGVETDTNDSYPHRYWHAGAQWIMNTLFDAWRTTHDRAWLERIYPLMKETAQYYEDVLVELPDGTLGFNPSYSPENWPQGKRPTSVNATMDQAAARQCFRNAIEAAEALGVDEKARKIWAKKLSRLTPYAVSENGFFAEWLAPGQPDNNEHRHASHLYALYDDAPEEIVTNAALVAAVKKTIDARMDFNENRSRTMAFGYVQLGLAATKIGDGERALRCLNLLSKKNWTEAFGSFHDWHNIFNTDISGGYPYLVSEMLVQPDNDSVTFLAAKPECWTRGRIAGLALRGAVKLEYLEWEGENWKARLRTDDGRTLNFSGTGRKTVSTSGETPLPPADKGVYQWGVEVDGVVSRETKAPPRAYLWIPETCKELRGVVISNDNMLEEPLFSEPSFRKNLAEADCGIIFVTPGFQGMNEKFDLENDKPIVAALLKKLADESGYSELKDKTLLAPLGHSAWSDWGYFIANAFPERTACAVSLKGSWPHMKGRFFDDAFAARLKGIPLLLVSGEYEGPIADNKARSSALAAKWGIDLRIECDWRSGHFEYSPELRDFIGRWIRDGVLGARASSPRRESSAGKMPALPEGGEWPQSMPDGEFALLGFRGKDGEEIAQNPRDHLQITIPTMWAEGEAAELKVVPCFGTVVPPGRPERWTGKKAGDAADKPDAPESAIDWFVVQGPGVKTAQDKVAIRFNRHGFAGYRAREIVLAAVYQGDGKFKRSTQQAMLRFPLKAREGEVAEPNGWFVREGSATVDDAGSITWLPLPPRARKPHNATLCRYAYSNDGELVYSLETIPLPE